MAYEDESETIQSLLDIMHEHDLDRIKVKVGDAVYELVRREAGAADRGTGGRHAGGITPPAAIGGRERPGRAGERQAGDARR